MVRVAKKQSAKSNKSPVKKPVAPAPAARKSAASTKKGRASTPAAELPSNGSSGNASLPRAGSDRLLTLSFLRDGDEFCVRLEMASGQITEFKNRSPDQLLTMVAGELEDLLG